ncbi:MAG: hypothetical protein ACTSQJ_07590 [Promethearchaeota archaeon]
MTLEDIEFLNGLLATIFVLISVVVGLKILLKYFELKKRVFLFFGLTWILIVCPWYPFMISFFISLLTNKGLPLQVYIILGNILIPPGILIGVAAFTELKLNEKQKLLVFIFAILAIVMEILLVTFIIFNPEFIGQMNDRVDFEYSLIFRIYLLAMLAVILTAGILFSYDSLKSEDKTIRLKGKFLITAFITFSIGTALEATVPLTFISLVITRLFLIFSAFSFYCGFILPKWMERIFGLDQ